MCNRVWAYVVIKGYGGWMLSGHGLGSIGGLSFVLVKGVERVGLRLGK